MTDHDFQIIGTDTDGTLICKGIPSGDVYNCGETLEEFGLDNLRESDTI